MMGDTDLCGQGRKARHIVGETRRTATDAWAEETGTEPAARLRAVIGSAPIVLFALASNGIITLSDGRGLSALGLRPGDIVGRSALDLSGAVEATDEGGNKTTGAEALRRALSGEEFVGQCRIDDAVFDFRLVPERDETTGEVRRVVGVATDVTKRTRTEAQLRDARQRLLVADRLAGIGTLAAGAAHEINNPLTYALINLEHVAKQLRAACGAGYSLTFDDQVDRLPALVQAVQQAEEGMRRVRNIVRNLLTFSNGAVEVRSVVDLRGIVESSIQMAMHELVHRGRVTRDFGEVPPVLANETALGQVFLNLLVNAAQAIPETGSSSVHEVSVTLRTDEEGNAVVEVSDTGVGIPPEHLPRIFDPFFTLKGPNQGTGLGLSISHATVTGLGGRIEVASRVGKGSSFRVVLPPSRHARSSAGRITVSPDDVPRRRVLVIDDDAPVGEAIARVLQDEAEVEVLTDGRAAMTRLAPEERWDVILCDLMMPGVSGIEVYAAALERAPNLAGHFVFMTAGAFTPRARAFVASVPDRCLEKPLSVDRIREIVRRGGPA
jgi:signal transduction histidine kinase